MPATDRFEPLENLDLLAEQYERARRGADESTRRRLRDEFLGRAMPMAGRLARRFRGRGESAEDLEQVARLGLLKTVDRYEAGRGSFTAYAVVTITGELRRHFRDHTWGVHVTRRMQDLALELIQATVLLTATLSRAPTNAELAHHLGVDEETVREAQGSLAAYHPSSLNLPADLGGSREVGEKIGADDPDLDLVEDRTTVRGLLRHLPARERRMLMLRFYGNYSQAEIAEELGISQMHVSRLLSRALTWLREAMLSDPTPRWTGATDTDRRVRISVNRRGDEVIAHVGGEIDRDNAGNLRDALLGAVDQCEGPSARLVVDLNGVPLLDAAGIGALLGVSEAARVRSVSVHIAGVQPYVARVLQISGVRHG